MTRVYVNGEFVPREEATVSVYDHGLLYGDGVFEGIRAYDGRVFKLEQHVDRLYDSARAIGLRIPLTKDEMTEAILETLRTNNLTDAYIRPIVTRGVGDLGLDPRKCTEPNLIIITQQWEAMYGDLYETGLRAVTVGVKRNPPEALPPNVKSLNYLNNILAKIQANDAGADEAVFLDIRGNVSEGSGDNIFVVKRGVVKTPPTINNLKGITRRTVIELAGRRDHPVEEVDIGLFDIYTADEVFVTGTAAEVAPISEIDSRKIGDGEPGPVTRELMDAFSELTGTQGTEIYRGPSP
ncbi:MAG: putative branched-chain-amino-acid aminotransferase [Methanonatronarchaeales archaeon]|nr:putative branched-chain-amino-acid aminotransferase [Methanonatronarchaeales archaeon]